MNRHLSRKRRLWLLIVCVVASCALVLCIPKIWVRHAPTFDELSLSLAPLIATLEIEAAVERDVLNNSVLGNSSKVTARVSDVIGGRPEAIISRIADVLEESGFRRIKGLEPDNALSGSWTKDEIRIDAFVDGVEGEGEQSVTVGLIARPG